MVGQVPLAAGPVTNTATILCNEEEVPLDNNTEAAPLVVLNVAPRARDDGAYSIPEDVALVVPIYPAREQPIAGVSSELVVEAARRR